MLNLLPQTILQRFDPLRFVSGFLRPMGCRISSPSVISKFILGLMLGFLPCGLIYAALLKAMASGSALNGALTMLAYGLGTVSALMTVGLFSSSFHWRFGRWGNRLAAISITLLGVLSLMARVNAFTECKQSGCKSLSSVKRAIMSLSAKEIHHKPAKPLPVLPHRQAGKAYRHRRQAGPIIANANSYTPFAFWCLLPRHF